MVSRVRNIVYGRKYQSQGEEKVKWYQCGILIEKDGKFYVKLEMVPVGMDPDQGIFFNVFDQNHNRQGEADKNRRDVPGDDQNYDDDIPF